MNTLITGIDGFIGGWMKTESLKHNERVFGISRKKTVNEKMLKIFKIDITNKKNVFLILHKVKPDVIYHLAAQSNISYSFSHPQLTLRTNVGATLNFLTFLRQTKWKGKFMSVGSAAEYGSITRDHARLSEDDRLSPTSPYAVSKATQGMLTQVFHDAFGINSVHIRPFAIIGPGKIGDAISDFAKGIVKIERGKQKKLLVGDLDRIRDFVDIRDAILGMRLVAEKGKDNIYNLCTGTGTSLKKVLDILVSLAQTEISVATDPTRQRPSDDQVIVGDQSKIRRLGFKSRFSLEETLKDTLNYWRSQF